MDSWGLNTSALEKNFLDSEQTEPVFTSVLKKTLPMYKVISQYPNAENAICPIRLVSPYTLENPFDDPTVPRDKRIPSKFQTYVDSLVTQVNQPITRLISGDINTEFHRTIEISTAVTNARLNPTDAIWGENSKVVSILVEAITSTSGFSFDHKIGVKITARDNLIKDEEWIAMGIHPVVYLREKTEDPQSKDDLEQFTLNFIQVLFKKIVERADTHVQSLLNNRWNMVFVDFQISLFVIETDIQSQFQPLKKIPAEKKLFQPGKVTTKNNYFSFSC